MNLLAVDNTSLYKDYFGITYGLGEAFLLLAGYLLVIKLEAY
jgi:hypothetical protein